jgi:hypothetical protein
MSRKTRADLEAENSELKALVAELKLDNRGLRSANEVLLEEADWNRFVGETCKKAQTAIIEQYVPLSTRAHVLAYERQHLEDANKSRGGNSYKQYKPVHLLAARYFRLKCRQDPKCLPGKVAGEVRKHCLERPNRYEYVPAQKSIKERLKKLL